MSKSTNTVVYFDVGRRLFIFTLAEYVTHNLCCQIRADDNPPTCIFTTAHVLMRLYPIDKSLGVFFLHKAEEWRHVRMFCRSLIVLLPSFFWPLCYLSFSRLRILITSLVSSSFPYLNSAVFLRLDFVWMCHRFVWRSWISCVNILNMYEYCEQIVRRLWNTHYINLFKWSLLYTAASPAENENKFPRFFNFTFAIYIEDVLSLNNLKYCYCLFHVPHYVCNKWHHI